MLQLLRPRQCRASGCQGAGAGLRSALPPGPAEERTSPKSKWSLWLWPPPPCAAAAAAGLLAGLLESSTSSLAVRRPYSSLCGSRRHTCSQDSDAHRVTTPNHTCQPSLHTESCPQETCSPRDLCSDHVAHQMQHHASSALAPHARSGASHHAGVLHPREPAPRAAS